MQSKKTQNSTYKICDRKFSPFLPSANTQTRTESPFEAEGHRDRTMVSITSIVAVALTAASTALAGVAAPQSGIIRYKWYRDPECKGIYQALDADIIKCYPIYDWWLGMEVLGDSSWSKATCEFFSLS